METNQLIKLCLLKDENAFKTLVDQHIDYAFSVAFRLINDEDESKDIVQEAFITVWKKLKSFDLNKSFQNWFYKIIVNKCYDQMRKKKRYPEVHPDHDGEFFKEMIHENNPEKQMSNDELGFIIKKLTETLSPKQKTVFVLSEIEELSHDEISEITGLDKSTIKSNLNHARRNIGERIKTFI